jgi:hypothetical protein
MRELLDALWRAPQAEFVWFMGVMWDHFLYVAVSILLLRWLWRKGNGPPKK